MAELILCSVVFIGVLSAGLNIKRPHFFLSLHARNS